MESTDPIPEHVGTERALSFKVAALLLIAVLPLAGIFFRHFIPIWVDVAVLTLLLGLPAALAVLFRHFRGRAIDAQPVHALAKKDLLWYSWQNEIWRRNLAFSMIFAIGVICLLLVLAGLLLMAESGSFFALVLWLTPGVGFLIAATISIVAVFAGAAGLGPRLIKLIAGRVPMGRNRSRGSRVRR